MVFIYKATVDHIKPANQIFCACESCEWQGTVDNLIEIGDAILTPGHASPAGRCPGGFHFNPHHEDRIKNGIRRPP